MNRSVHLFASLALGLGCSQSAVALRTGDAAPDAPRQVPPLCNGTETASLGQLGGDPCPTMLGWGASASGAFTYAPMMCGDSAASGDVLGTLAAIDLAASTFTLATSRGDVVVALQPLQASWLGSLPMGRDLTAHFENGVVLRDATTTALLLAVVQRISFQPPDFDIAPIHVAAGDTRCVEVSPAPGPCDPGQYHVHSQLDVAFTLGASSIMATVGHSPVTLADANDTFEVVLSGSIVQGGITADDLRVCDVALLGGTWVAIGRPPS